MNVVSRRRAIATGCSLGLVVLVGATAASPASAAARTASATQSAEKPPGRVRDLTVTPGGTSVAITWKAPTGHDKITDYRIYQSTTRTFRSPIKATTSTSYTATDVTSGTNYYFAVRAEDKAGKGKPVITRDPVSVGAPSAVTDLTATASSNTSIALSWSAPRVPGAKPTDKYIVEIVKDGELTSLTTLTANHTTYTATDLSSSTSYVFVVRAVSLGGDGPGLDVTGQTAAVPSPTAEAAWTELSPATSPPDENHAAMAYDDATGTVVMFGGFGSGGDTNRTWIWNGTTWTQQFPDNSPPALDSAVMSYDPATQQLLLFGGGTQTMSDGTVYSDETWRWSNGNWRQLHPTHSPPGVVDASMAYDASTRQLILYGGIGTEPLTTSTWLWTGTDWSALAPKAQPVADANAAMAYDTATGQLILFGGTDDQGSTDNTTWNWTGTNWVQLTTPSTATPDGVANASLGFSDLTDRLVLIGGDDSMSVDQDTTWTWNGAKWQKTTLAGPPAGDSAAMAYDAATAQLILFGGTGAQATTWSWGDSPGLGLTWALRTGVGPSPRDGAAMAYDPTTGELILFGGEDQTSKTRLADTWAWSGDAWVHLHPTTSPPARAFAGMAYDDATGQLILFGGNSGNNSVLGDTWAWNDGDWHQLTPSDSPTKRSGPALGYDDATGQLVLFGGKNSASQLLSDTWNWTGTDWATQTTSTATTPAARSGVALVFDPAADVLVLGNVARGADSTWNGTAWSKSNPDLRFDGGPLTYYPYSGKLDGVTTDTSSVVTGSGGQPVLAPPGRSDSSFSFDPASGRLVLFGGYEDASTKVPGQLAPGSVPIEYGDTWVQVPATTPPGAPTALTGTAGDGEIDLSWKAPEADGGEPISGYNVYEGTTPGGESATPINSSPLSSSATTDDVTGLADGTTYYFTVVAINSLGSSAPSTEATAETFAPPGPPLSLTAVAGNTTVNLSWAVPTSNGGTPITGYNVFATVAGQPQSSPVNGSPIAADTTTYQVSGLTDATDYTFTVVALNEIGSGDASNAVDATPFEAPDPPTASVAVGNGQLEVTWTPGPDNGEEITGYNVYEGTTPGGEAPQPVNASPVPGHSLLVTGLSDGTQYYFTVTAINDGGASLPSGEVGGAPALVPATLADLTATSSTTDVVLRWKPGAQGAGVSAITGYNVYLATAAGQESSTPINTTPLSATASSYSIAGLTKGETYWFDVEALNAVGSSLPSNEVSGAIETVPSAVFNVKAVAESGEVHVSWSAPTHTGGTPITGYDVYQSTSKTSIGSIVDSPSASTNVVVTGLTNGTTYFFTVLAINRVGKSAQATSDTTRVEPVGPPGAPTVTASASSSSVSLHWTEPADGGSPITSYTLSGSGTVKSLGTTTVGSNVLTYKLSGLKPHEEYKFDVKATNTYGTGAGGKVTISTS